MRCVVVEVSAHAAELLWLWRCECHTSVLLEWLFSLTFLLAFSTLPCYTLLICSTITAECARAFSSSTFMPEYGREYWETHAIDRRLTPEQLVEIALGHAEREEAAARACDGPLFIDTNAVTTAMFALDYHGAIHPQLARLADAASSRYDVVFLCCDDIPYEDTADRSG